MYFIRSFNSYLTQMRTSIFLVQWPQDRNNARSDALRVHLGPWGSSERHILVLAANSNCRNYLDLTAQKVMKTHPSVAVFRGPWIFSSSGEGQSEVLNLGGARQFRTMQREKFKMNLRLFSPKK